MTIDGSSNGAAMVRHFGGGGRRGTWRMGWRGGMGAYWGRVGLVAWVGVEVAAASVVALVPE
jgi:hypothetical protein